MALGKTVTQLRHEMPYAEFLDWEILEEVDPFGQKRTDWHFAKLYEFLAHGLGIRKKSKKDWEWHDFLPPFPLRPVVTEPVPVVLPPKEPQTVQYMESVFRLWVKGHNLTIRQGRPRRKKRS